MELFLKEISHNKKWKKISKVILIFYAIYLPSRFIFELGFINPVANFLLGFLTTLSPIIIFLFFPFSRFRPILKLLFIFIFILATLGMSIFILFQIVSVRDVIRTGYDPTTEEIKSYKLNYFVRRVEYTSDCGATCSIDKYQVSEIVLFNLIKMKIPGTLESIGEIVSNDQFVTYITNNDLAMDNVKKIFNLKETQEDKNIYSFEKNRIDKVLIYGDKNNEIKFWEYKPGHTFLMQAEITSPKIVLNNNIFIGMEKSLFTKQFNVDNDKDIYKIETLEESMVFTFKFEKDVLREIDYLDSFTH